MFTGIDNTQLIEIAKRSKRSKPQNHRQLERNWNAASNVNDPPMWSPCSARAWEVAATKWTPLRGAGYAVQ